MTCHWLADHHAPLPDCLGIDCIRMNASGSLYSLHASLEVTEHVRVIRRDRIHASGAAPVCSSTAIYRAGSESARERSMRLFIANPSISRKRSGREWRRRCTGSRNGTRCWIGTRHTPNGSSVESSTPRTYVSTAQIANGARRQAGDCFRGRTRRRETHHVFPIARSGL